MKKVSSIFSLIAIFQIVAIGTTISRAQIPELVSENGHLGVINAVVFSPDGKTLASASDDQTVKLWELSTGNVLRTFRGHTSNVTSCDFSPDGNNIVSGSNDETVRVWDVASGKERLRINPKGSDERQTLLPADEIVSNVHGNIP